MPFRHEFDWSLGFEAAIAGAVFLVVVVTMAVALVVFRARRAGAASQDTEHTKVEIAYAVFLLAVAIGVIVVTRHANAADETQAPHPAVTVQVTGFQWCWHFRYLDPPISVLGNCHNGTRPTLVVPAGRPVRFETTSTDVIHSFWVPEFRFKMDAFPNHTNSFTMTVPRPGRWEGHCAEFCGERHDTMTFTLQALPAAQYAAWALQHETTAVTPAPTSTMGAM